MTRRASRTTKLLCCALAAAALLPRAARASAADAFENKVKPVSGQLYQKAGRIELTLPVLGLSVNDAFFSKYLLGAKVGYHVNEYLSVAATGALATNSATGSTAVCPFDQGCHPATQQQLYQVPGYVSWTAGLEVGFAPIYGKLNLFAEKAIHFDLSIAAGPDLVAYRDVLTADQVKAGATPGTVTAIGGHVGVGARVFLARFMALRLEVKDLLYQVPHLATGKLQTQLMGELGLSFFFPIAQRDAP
jgi:outer membrane beta-barrel protein